MGVLAISSHVVYGRVGNRAAEPALSAHGIECWPLNTVTFSNHPGHGRFTGRGESRERLEHLLAGLDDLAVWGEAEGLLAGYLGQGAAVPAVAAAIARLRAARPDAPVCLDPVLGDGGRLFVPEDLPGEMARDLVPAADLVTPNPTELAALTGMAVGTVAEARAAAEALRAQGPQSVVVTGGEPLGESGESLSLAVTGEGAWAVATPRLAAPVHGCGDLLSAHVLAGYLRGRAVPDALRRAVDATYAALVRTAEAERRELQLAGAEALLADPPATATLRRLDGAGED